jgi:hypothetical protein
MAITSTVTITENSDSSATLFLNQVQGCVPSAPVFASPASGGDVAHNRDIKNAKLETACFHATFINEHHATGLGDITLRAKGTVWKGERAGLGLGLDFRIPTGDETNFLGSGAFGVKPFVIWSYSGQISPHVNFGYEWNGTSKLGGDLSIGTKGKLPSQLLYSAGIEIGIIKRLTAAFDFLGQRVFDGPRIIVAPVTVLGLCDIPALPGEQDPNTNQPINCQKPASPTQVPGITGASASYGIHNESVGLRFRPFRGMLVSANVLIKLDDGGLRSQFTPLVSATYTLR